MDDTGASIEDLVTEGYWDETWMDSAKREAYFLEPEELVFYSDWNDEALKQDRAVSEFCDDIMDRTIETEDMSDMYGHLGWYDDKGPTIIGVNIYFQCTGRLP